MPNNANKKHVEFADRYAKLMSEIYARLNAIPIIRRELMPRIPRNFVYESEYLQLRIVCDLIAVGCLIAHGDIPATRAGKLRAAKYPTMIIPELEKLHPDFYPVPFDMVGLDHRPLADGFLTKNDLLTLYAECGDAVHRGSLKTLTSDRADTPKTENIAKWVNLTKRLLVQHMIELANPKVIFRFRIGPNNVDWGILHEISHGL
jgi:hypothetical protein